jgi:hypothetical protein
MSPDSYFVTRGSKFRAFVAMIWSVLEDADNKHFAYLAFLMKFIVGKPVPLEWIEM